MSASWDSHSFLAVKYKTTIKLNYILMHLIGACNIRNDLNPERVCFFVCYWSDSPPVGQGLLIHEVSRSHTTTHHSR